MEVLKCHERKGSIKNFFLLIRFFSLLKIMQSHIHVLPILVLLCPSEIFLCSGFFFFSFFRTLFGVQTPDVCSQHLNSLGTTKLLFQRDRNSGQQYQLIVTPVLHSRCAHWERSFLFSNNNSKTRRNNNFWTIKLS